MKIKIILLIVINLLLACQNDKPKNNDIDKNLIINNLDLYPQYPTCPDYFEKEQQLECLMKEVNQFLKNKLNNEYRKEFSYITDTFWVKFKIDTLGITNYKSVKLKNDSIKTNFDSIFNKIGSQIPKMKPAIYKARPVNFEFMIPVIITNDTIKQ